VSILRALTFTARDSNGTTTRIVTDRNEWFALIADELLVDLDTVDESARDRLWASACAAHAARDVHT
jgi:hypothetical protein